MIRYLLNIIPRRYLQRVAHWVVPVVGLAYRGRGEICPVCGKSYRRFMPYGYGDVRHNALCPNCLSLERHRQMWQWLREETDFFERQPLRVLHIAPERCLSRRFANMPGIDYVTADLESPLAKVRMDIQQMPFGEGEFDVVFCNHVLEHVPDDRRALREIHRVMKKGGWGVVMSPVDLSRAETFEDPSAVTPAQRMAAHGQHDHLRIYGADYPQRLAEAGFSIEFIEPELYIIKR